MAFKVKIFLLVFILTKPSRIQQRKIIKMKNIARTTRQVSRNPFDVLMNDFFEGEFNAKAKPTVLGKPLANVFETKEDYRVELLVPGFEKSELDISIDGKILVVKGGLSTSTQERKQLRKEFGLEDFQRSFKLTDDVSIDNVEANYSNGILEVVLKKLEPQKEETKRIEIK
jgi:HSP20 family protein